MYKANINNGCRVVAIDPDTAKSGVAELADGELKIKNLTLAELQHWCSGAHTAIIEKSWASAHIHRLSYCDSKAIASRKGYDVGRNHQRGLDIAELLESQGVEVVYKDPLRKCWKGKEKKITHIELIELLKVNNIKCANKRTNQEQRDAALLLLSYFKKC